ncbi:hypothetical protein K1719_034252 [Acacia pycnantha]|nr:hypothetical protein K1719_034252 [Acacia pycnantha]
MGTGSFMWSFTKKLITLFELNTVTVTDRYMTIVPVRDDYVLVEKFCLGNYRFSRGDAVVFCSPLNQRETHIKRIAALPGEWFGAHRNYDVLKVPEGHCWVEGDNAASSLDSNSFGAVSFHF